VIRPDGVDVQISSPATDQLGRSGVGGNVDNKYFETLSSSLLVTLMTIGGSAALDSVRKAQTTSTSNTTDNQGNVTTTQTGETTDLAVLEGVENLSDISKKLAGSLISAKPTITIDQGTRVKVFVNKDIIFPSGTSSGTRFIN
jgi:type IV secretion system protein VirB10